MKTKLTISIDDKLLDRIDSFCASSGLSRSAFLSVSATDYLRAKEIAPEIKVQLQNMLSSWQGVLDGSISPDDADKLTDQAQLSIKDLLK